MPQPNTTGGNLMSYPSTVDTGLVAPITLWNDASIATAGSVLTAGAIYFVGIELLAPITVAQMRTSFGATSPTGNVDMGIYDATGTNGKPNNRLGSTGAILSTTGLFTQNLTANVSLSPGQYWLALVDNVADTPAAKTVLTAGLAQAWRSTGTSNTSLPSTAPALQTTSLLVDVEGLISGSFS